MKNIPTLLLVSKMEHNRKGVYEYLADQLVAILEMTDELDTAYGAFTKALYMGLTNDAIISLQVDIDIRDNDAMEQLHEQIDRELLRIFKDEYPLTEQLHDHIQQGHKVTTFTANHVLFFELRK